MQVNQLSVKLFARREDGVDDDVLIPVFHRWIRELEHRLCGKLLIDVADYRHVVDGPGVMLIGHEAHWAVGRQGGGGLGLTYTRKADVAGPLADKLGEAFRDALTAATRLEGEVGLGLGFDGARARLRFMGRLHAGNDEAGLAAARPELERFAGTLWGSATASAGSRDPRDPLTIDVAGKPATVAELLARLE